MSSPRACSRSGCSATTACRAPTASPVAPSDSSSSARRFPRHHPQFVEPEGFGPGEWPAGEFGQGGAAPQGKCLVEDSEGCLAGHLCGGGRGVGCTGTCGRVALEGEPVPGGGLDEAAAGRAGRAPRAGDLCSQRSLGVLGQCLAPQLVNEPVCWDQVVGAKEQGA